MNRDVVYKQFEMSENSIETDYFVEARNTVEAMLEHLDVFRDEPSTATGISHLAELLDEHRKLLDIYGQDDAPFSHHAMNRVGEAVWPLGSYYNRVQNTKQDSQPTYWLGKCVEQARRRLEAIEDEWDTCVEYSKSND